MDIQWYPGHMAKTKRQMRESMPLIDLVVEIVDARIPISSRNPEFDSLFSKKPRIVLLNKSDIADEQANAVWVRHFYEQGIHAIAADCKSGKGLNAFSPLVRVVMAKKIERYKQKGMVNRLIRIMVAGIPNSGKSTFINRLSSGGKAKAADRPGVTRGHQWFSTRDGFELLDTPGLLYPKLNNPTTARHLAYTGAIKDEVLNIEELAYGLLEILRTNYSDLLSKRYKLTEQLPDDCNELLNMIGRRRGMLMPGGIVDTERASVMLLDEFRGGKIGRITLEFP